MNSNAKDGLRLVSSPAKTDIKSSELSLSGRKLRVPIIQTIEGLRDYRCLKTLDLSLNNISRISGLDTLIQLTSLNLSQNFISVLEGLRTLSLLQTLDLSDNRIQALPKKELSPLLALRTLLLARNRLEDLEEVGQLATLPSLMTVYLEGNSVANARDFGLFVAFHVPGVKQVDSVLVTTELKQAALKKYSKRKTDVFLVRENLVSFRKQISELQDTKHDLLDERVLIQAQLSALEVDFKQVSDELSRCKEEKRDVERMMSCTPGDQLHSKKSQMMEAISKAEITRDETEHMSRRIQQAKTDVQSKEIQLETVRKRLRNRSGVTPADDFLSAEEQQIVTELKEMRLAVQALVREHSEKLRDMQATMSKINGLDKEIEEVKDGTIGWEQTYDEETAQYLPIRLTELDDDISKLTHKAEQIKAKNRQVLTHKSEIDMKLERTDAALSELKEKVRTNEVYAETGQSPSRPHCTVTSYASEELQAWEALKTLWALVSDSELLVEFGSLPIALIKWTDCFMKEWDRKEKEQDMNVSTVRRIGEAHCACLKAEMMEKERELHHYKQDNLSLSSLQTTVKALEGQIAAANGRISSLNNEISALRETIRQKDEKIEQLSHRELVLDEMNASMLQNIEEMTEVNDSLTRKLENCDREPFKSELKSLREECDRLRGAIAKAAEEQSETVKRISDGNEKLREISEELSQKEGKLRSVEEDLGLYLTLKQRKDDNLKAEAAVLAVASALSLEPDSIPNLTGKIANKLQEVKETAAKFGLFQKEQKEYGEMCERKFAQIRNAREKLSSDQTAFRKTQKTILEKMQNDKSALDRHCKSLRTAANKLSDEIETRRDELTALNHRIATAQRVISQLQFDQKPIGRISSKDLQEPLKTDRSFIVLRSSPDIGFASPVPKSHKKNVSSLMSLNRCPTDEDRCSSVQTDRMYRGSPQRRVSRCSTSRTGDESRIVTQGSERPSKNETVLRIEEELEALKAQLDSFCVDQDPLPRQFTV